MAQAAERRFLTLPVMVTRWFVPGGSAAVYDLLLAESLVVLTAAAALTINLPWIRIVCSCALLALVGYPCVVVVWPGARTASPLQRLVFTGFSSLSVIVFVGLAFFFAGGRVNRTSAVLLPSAASLLLGAFAYWRVRRLGADADPGLVYGGMTALAPAIRQSRRSVAAVSAAVVMTLVAAIWTRPPLPPTTLFYLSAVGTRGAAGQTVWVAVENQQGTTATYHLTFSMAGQQLPSFVISLDTGEVARRSVTAAVPPVGGQRLDMRLSCSSCDPQLRRLTLWLPASNALGR